MDYYELDSCCEKKHNFNIDNASTILNFDIRHLNKNCKINNDLFHKSITQKLLKKLTKIKGFYDKFIKERHQKLLNIFLARIKQNYQKEEDFDEKFISFMIIEHEEIYDQTPRVIQIISLLYYLEGYKEKYNLIQEVLTGEGKTLTISFLALYLAIIGNKVDILTSSPVLAQRDSKDRKKLYNRFGISCDFCRIDLKNDTSISNEKKFECYKADIVYGDTTSLIGDILLSEFMGKNGRGDRPFDNIIVDEIDNICIDNLRNLVELIDNFPGYKYLEYIYLFIYKQLKEKTDELKKNNKGNKDDFAKTLKKQAELIIHDISMDTRKFLYYNKKMKYDDEKHILIPENSYEFIYSRIEHWGKMAYDAMFNFEKNKNYFISEDKNIRFITTIKPIDYENTGVILTNSIWSGLHQFLQIKEGLTLTEENINSSFMSYLSFFKKYNIINGITGTLGSKMTQQAMNIIYNINLIKMPTFKLRSLQLYEPRIFPDQNLFKEKLIDEIIKFSVQHNRVVLVIFEYMSQVMEMADYLKKNRKKFKLDETKIIPYYRSDIENKFLERQMVPNTVIISTNLSGRGTDIKINEKVKKNGGLHVVLTFMPYNERTEKQAQGRAGRCGDKGSSVTIIQAKNNYKTLEENRTKHELEQYKFLINLYVPQSDLNQKFFDKFCQKLHQIENDNKNITKNIVLDLTERWSMFNLKNNINSIMNDSINANCAGQVYRLYERITSKNFKVLMREINIQNLEDYNFYNTFNQMKKDLPDKIYQNSIKKNPGFSIGAYYNQAYSAIIHKNPNYQILVYNNFNILSKLCNKFINQYQTCMDVFNEIHENDGINYDFSVQFQNKKKVMKFILNNVEKNLSRMKKIPQNLITEIGIEILNKFSIDTIETDFKPPNNIIEYFSDFGIEFFFEINYNDTCLIF